MEQLLQLFVFIPLLGFVLSLLFANKQEKLISGVAYSIVGLQLAGLSVFIVSWLLHGASVLNLKHFVFYKEDTIEIFLDFYFDKSTAMFSFVGALITFSVTLKHYLLAGNF